MIGELPLQCPNHQAYLSDIASWLASYIDYASSLRGYEHRTVMNCQVHFGSLLRYYARSQQLREFSVLQHSLGGIVGSQHPALQGLRRRLIVILMEGVSP